MVEMQDMLDKQPTLHKFFLILIFGSSGFECINLINISSETTNLCGKLSYLMFLLKLLIEVIRIYMEAALCGSLLLGSSKHLMCKRVMLPKRG